MPTHTAASALIKLFCTDGAPWSFSQWQAITGVTHGLMPLKDEHLPKGLTRSDIINIASYFAQYAAKPSEDDKIKFASKEKKVGKDRSLYDNTGTREVCINYNYLSKKPCTHTAEERLHCCSFCGGDHPALSGKCRAL